LGVHVLFFVYTVSLYDFVSTRFGLMFFCQYTVITIRTAYRIFIVGYKLDPCIGIPLRITAWVFTISDTPFYSETYSTVLTSISKLVRP